MGRRRGLVVAVERLARPDLDSGRLNDVTNPARSSTINAGCAGAGRKSCSRRGATPPPVEPAPAPAGQRFGFGNPGRPSEVELDRASASTPGGIASWTWSIATPIAPTVPPGDAGAGVGRRVDPSQLLVVTGGHYPGSTDAEEAMEGGSITTGTGRPTSSDARDRAVGAGRPGGRRRGRHRARSSVLRAPSPRSTT